MVTKDISDRALALAAVFQAAKLVKEVAWSGKLKSTQLELAVSALINQQPKSTVDVIGNPNNVKDGFKSLLALFERKEKPDPEVTRYALSILHLEKTLSKNKQMLQKVSSGIKRVKNQADIFSLTHENVIANIAGIYTDTISTLSFRIQVAGEPSVLNSNPNANRVRALLLYGIRCAVLWRQLGGNRWQFLFGKGNYTKAAKYWLNSIDELEPKF